MTLENAQRMEQVDYTKNIDGRESPKEKKIFSLIENADGAIEKGALAEKLNDHFQFVALMRDLGKEAPDKNYISSEDVTNFVQKRFPTAAQQKELFGALALWFKTQGIIFSPGSVSHDFSNIPITGKQKDVEFGMRMFAGDYSGAIINLEGEDAAMPQVVQNNGPEVIGLRARNAGNRFDKAKQAINDTKRGLKRARGEANRSLSQKIPDLQSALQVSLDSMAHATRDMLQKDPLARDQQTRYFLQHFYDNYKDYTIYFPEHERNSNYKQAEQYDQRIQKLLGEIKNIQIDAWEDHMTQKHFGSFALAQTALTETWLDDNFVPEKNSIKQKALQKAMSRGVPGFVDQYYQQAVSKGNSGIDAILSLLDKVQYKMDQNNRQSTSLKGFYAQYIPLLQQSVASTLEKEGANYEQHIHLFKLVTGRSINDKKPEKTLIGQLAHYYAGPMTGANIAEDIAWYNSERIDDDVKNFDLAEQQLLHAGLYKNENQPSLYDTIIAERGEAMGVPSQENYNTLIKSVPSFIITNKDGTQNSYDVCSLLGVDSALDVQNMSFDQLQSYKSLEHTLKDPAIENLWPNTDTINLEIFFQTVEKHAQNTQTELGAKLISQLGLIDNKQLPKHHQELHALMTDYYGENGIFDMADRNIQEAKIIGKKIAVLGGTAAIAAATAGSSLPFLGAAALTGASGVVLHKTVNQEGVDTYMQLPAEVGFGAAQGILLGSFGRIAAIKSIGIPPNPALEGTLKEIGIKAYLKNFGITQFNKQVQNTLQKPLAAGIGEAQQVILFDKEINIEKTISDIMQNFGSDAGMETLVEIAINTDDSYAAGAIANSLHSQAKTIIPQYEQARDASSDPKEKQQINDLIAHWKIAQNLKQKISQ